MTPAYTLAQVIERLPAHARERYETLVAEVADSKALVATLMERFESAQKEYRRLESRHDRAVRIGSSEAAELQSELDALAARVDKLERERHRRNSIATSSEQIIIRLRSFVEAYWLGGSSNITEPPKVSVTPQLQDGESLTCAIARLRQDIQQARGELAMVRNAPLPKEEAEIAIMLEVDRLADLGRPRIALEGNRAKFQFADDVEFTMPGLSHPAPAGGASKLLCWFFRDAMTRRLISGVEEHPNAIPARERPERLRGLEEKLFGLEVQEEAFVADALAAGLEAHRRGDANPWAVLGYGLAPAPPVAVAEAAE